jgi:hypothetical protein
MITVVKTEQITEENLEECFRFAPWQEDQLAAGKLVVDALIAAARVILQQVPPSPDRSVALRKLREARMDCNSAITHRGRF